MLLFLISIFLVFATSFFFSSILEEKSFVKFLIYFLLISFANIVLMFEILSLFSAISIIGVLCFNFLFATVALILWRKFGKPLPKFDFCGFFSTFCIRLLLCNVWFSRSTNHFVLSVLFIISSFINENIFFKI